MPSKIMIKLGNNSIGKVYLGSNLINKAYLGEDLVYNSEESSKIIPYIRSTSAYIDTGITPDQTTRVIIWARNWNPGTNSVWLFGSRVGSLNAAFNLSLPGSGSTGCIRVGFANENVDTGEQFALLSGYHKYELNRNVFSVDGTVVATATDTTFSNEYNLHLFGMNNGGTHVLSAGIPVDICACRIYKNGTLVRNFTPVNSPSVGFYDSVSETVFTSLGSGSFTYGTFDLTGYKPLQYVECQSYSFFDTGIYGSNSLPIVTKIQPGGEEAAYRWLLGARTSSSSGLLDFEIGGNDGNNNIFYMNYGNTAVSSSNVLYNSSSLTGYDLVWIKSDNVSTLYRDGTSLGTATVTAQTFTTSYTMAIGARNNAGTLSNGYRGRIYYVGFGASGSFVPMEHNGVAGLYEMYSDTFFTSTSGNDFVAGPPAVRTRYFRNKRISIIGDSISTYNASGYKYDSYSMYYPQGNVNNVNKTYWKLLMDSENASLVRNLSYAGSRATNTSSGMPSLCDRVSLIGNCDTVIIAMGTNDSGGNVSLGNYSYDTAISSLSESTFRDAYIKGIKMLLEARPDIRIVCLIFHMNDSYRNSIKEIANHYGLKCLDCGNNYSKIDTLHPNAKGMWDIYVDLLYI